jgi:hypothetical protein
MNTEKFREKCNEYFIDPGCALENKDLVRLLETEPTEDHVCEWFASNC